MIERHGQGSEGPAGPGALFTVSDSPDPIDVAFLEYQVMAATMAATGHADARELAVFVRDEEDEVRAGVYGWTWGRCCELQSLWVDRTLGGRGLARALMDAAEGEARRRGCGQVVLFTHDAQASGLYTRLGYRLVGSVEDYPAGGAARWFQKYLAPEPPAATPPTAEGAG